MEFDRNYVWITTRRLKPGTREAPTGTRVVGISIWDSPESRDRFSPLGGRGGTASGDGALRNRGKLRILYVGRRLKIPQR
jgi:hypothetical protein